MLRLLLIIAVVKHFIVSRRMCVNMFIIESMNICLKGVVMNVQIDYLKHLFYFYFTHSHFLFQFYYFWQRKVVVLFNWEFIRKVFAV